MTQREDDTNLLRVADQDDGKNPGIAKFNMLLNQPWNFLPLESLISDRINCLSC